MGAPSSYSRGSREEGSEIQNQHRQPHKHLRKSTQGTGRRGKMNIAPDNGDVLMFCSMVTLPSRRGIGGAPPAGLLSIDA